MSTSPQPAPHSATNQPESYVLGDSLHEYERLTLQAKILRPYTERYFRSAGVTQGMHVLDVGSGMGDVAMLAAEIVGPGGHVTGIDRDPNALANARRRTVEQGCSSWVNFEVTSLDDFSTSEHFDAILGRYVLLYLPDPGATLARLMRHLKPGGVIVFHDIDFPDPTPSDPPCPLFDKVYHMVGQAFSRSGVDPHFGRRLATAFTGAGLPFPTVVADGIVGGGHHSYIYRWITNTLMSVAPRLEALGIDVPQGMVIDASLAGKIEEAVIAAGSQIMAPTQYGAWARKPF